MTIVGKYFFIIFLFLGTVSRDVVAQESSWPDSVLALRYDLQQTAYTVNQSPANRMALIAVSEMLLNAHCLEISPHRGFEKADRPQCAALIQKTLLIDPKNPSAICARDGMNAPSCLEAYDHVQAKVVEANSPALKDKDVNAFIEVTNPADISTLDNQLAYETVLYREKKTEEAKEKLLSDFYDALSSVCSVIAYEVENTAAVSTPTPVPQGTVKPFASIIESLSKTTAGPINSADTFTHQRLVSSSCFSILERLSQVFPDSYLITCTHKGLYSPQCQRAYTSQNSKALKAKTGAFSNELGRF